MITKLEEYLDIFYEQDFYVWTEVQAELLL